MSQIAHGSGQFRAQSISIQLSTRRQCTGGCLFCISQTTPGTPIEDEQVKTCDLHRLNIGLRVAERMGASHAILTGTADPSQEENDYLMNVLGTATQYLPLVDMHTNGYLFLPGMPKHNLLSWMAASGLTMITLSIAGHSLEMNRLLMRMKKTPATPEFIGFLRNLGLMVRVSLVINKQGIHDVPGIMDYVKTLGNMGVQMVTIREVWVPEVYSEFNRNVYEWNKANRIDIGPLQTEFEEICHGSRDNPYGLRQGTPLPWGTPVFLVGGIFNEPSHGVNITFARCEEANAGTVIKSIVHKPDGHGYRNWDHNGDIIY